MAFKKLLLYKNGLFVYGLILFIINILLANLPLTSTFGYEFAAVNGLLLAVICGLYTIGFVNTAKFNLSNIIINISVLFAIPLIVTIINSILTMFCSFWDGLWFYIIIVSGSIMFGLSAALVINIITKKFNRIIFSILIFLVALVPVFEIYFNPQVYFFSPLIGFFPGNIYDEGLSPDWKLVFHQMIVIFISIAIIFLIVRKHKLTVIYKKYFIGLILIVAAVFQLISPYLGFATTFTTLNSKLSNEIKSELMTLHYDCIDSTTAQLIALNQEFYFSELSTQLKVRPSKKINVYLFNDRDQKKEIFGAGNADVAKPWQYSIYISADSWQQTLKHELAHVFTAEFGTGLFKLASGFNVALIEGMAESLDGISYDISLNDLTALAYNNGYIVNMKSLFTGLSFFKGNSSLAYTYSGAYIDFLIKNYGIEKVKEFYGQGDFDLIFGTNPDKVEDEFEKSLKNSQWSNNKSMADYYFGRLSIIQKVCPRFIGDRLSKAFKELSENNLEKAQSLFNQINSKSLNYSALIGLSETYLKQNKNTNATNLILKNYEKFKGTSYYHNMIFRLAELYAINLQNDSAAYYYKKIVEDEPNYQLINLANTRLKLLEANNLQEYIKGNDSLRFKMLVVLNEKVYEYSSIPIIIELMENLNIDYQKSLIVFNKTFIVENIESSIAAYKLSEYMFENSDYVNAKKYAALSLRFKEDNIFYKAMQMQFKKSNWFVKNANKLLDNFIFVKHNY
ncbi:MAG TPA: hypothetical protein DHV28_18115 [Ignavibacteriales bacterium]|nr:hypothetical protein [Ignavibacteriales bacterium]